MTTTVDITYTQTLKQGFEMLPQATSFLRDRYFPTNEATDIFTTEDVLIDYRDGDKKLAPFVKKGGKNGARVAFATDRFTPARIAPQRTLTVDELKKRGFGEAISSGLTPAQREAAHTLRDLQDMDAGITRSEEMICSKLLCESKVTLKHFVDGTSSTTEDVVIQFFDGETNPNTYTPATLWNKDGADIQGDLFAMAQQLIQNGRSAADLVLGSDAAAAVLSDEKIIKILDTNNYKVGALAPETLPAGVIHLGRLSIRGVSLDLFSYPATYTDDDGTVKPFIPADTAILTAPAVGRTLYGCVTQIEQIDKQFHSYPGRRVPKYLSNAETDSRTITLTACPLPAPNYKKGWVAAKVTGA